MKKVNKKSNSITVSEFKSWMSGVEDMQESGWVPSKSQWDRIKSKIALLSEESFDRFEQVFDAAQPPAQPVPQYQYNMPTYNSTPMGSDLAVQAATYYDPQQYVAPQLNPNDTVSYMSGEKLDFL
jgi:hypothetical protein